MNEFQKTNPNSSETQHTYSFNYETFEEFFKDLRKALIMYLTK
ncbi:MAG: hypothetical protein ACI4JM_05645 [Oscillospiraceae bacterium]